MVVSSSDSISSPGMTGTPAAFIVILAVILSPIISIALGDGPIQLIPALITASAKSARSDKNPKPGCIASAPCDAAIARICSWLRYVSAIVSPSSGIATVANSVNIEPASLSA